MPNRLLREGILTSEAVNALNWPEEVFYRRLMSVVDDFGRYYATPKLLRAACYPLHIDKVSDSDIGKWLSACETAALVRVYPASDGKRYLELLNFRQQVRAKASKFPAFDEQVRITRAADAKHPPANAHLDGVGDEDGGDGAPPSAAPPPQPPADDPKGSRLAKDWTLPDDWREWCAEHRPDLEPEAVAEQFRDFWHGKPGKDGRKSDWFATWRNWCRGQKTGTRAAPAQHGAFV